MLIIFFISFLSVAYSGDPFNSRDSVSDTGLLHQTITIPLDENNFDIKNLLSSLSVRVSFLEDAHIYQQHDLDRIKRFLMSCSSVQTHENADKMGGNEIIEIKKKGHKGSSRKPNDETDPSSKQTENVKVAEQMVAFHGSAATQPAVDASENNNEFPPKQKSRRSENQLQKKQINAGAGKNQASVLEKTTVLPSSSLPLQLFDIKKDKKVYFMHNGRIVVEDD